MCVSTVALCTLAAISAQDASATVPSSLPEAPDATISQTNPSSEFTAQSVAPVATPEGFIQPEFQANANLAGSSPVYEIQVELPPSASDPVPTNRSQVAQGRGSVTDQFGALGTQPNAERWRQGIHQRFGIAPRPTPVTDQFGVTGTQPNSERWLETARSRYGIASRPTQVTDRYGAMGSQPNVQLWYQNMKQRYGIGA